MLTRSQGEVPSIQTDESHFYTSWEGDLEDTDCLVYGNIDFES